MAIKIVQSASPEHDDYWKWSVWLDGSSSELNNVKEVVWRLHPTFSKPVRRATSRQSKFRLDTSGWGEFELYADVHLKGGKHQRLQHWVRLDEAKEGFPSKREKPIARARPSTIYLSYTRQNAELAGLVARELRRKGIIVTMDIDIPAGADLQRWGRDKILKSDAFVVLLGDDSGTWQAIEVNTAMLGGPQVIPITFHGRPVRHPRLNRITAIQVKDASPAAAPEVATRILQCLAESWKK